jgi:hypothetical protein
VPQEDPLFSKNVKDMSEISSLDGNSLSSLDPSEKVKRLRERRDKFKRQQDARPNLAESKRSGFKGIEGSNAFPEEERSSMIRQILI